MNKTLSKIDLLKEHAALVISIAREYFSANIGYTQEGVRWVDGYLRVRHVSDTPVQHAALSVILGAYLGECIIRNFGGEWLEVEGASGVRLEEGCVVFPIAQVARQLENGAEDSVLHFFMGIPAMLRQDSRAT